MVGTRRAAGMLVLAGFLGACASASKQETRAAAPAPISDAEIAAVVVTANAIDAEIGDLAAQRASSAEVRAFGKTMGTDHRAVNAQAGALVNKLGVTPAENDVSRKLKADAAAFKAELEKKSGADFDKTYISHEVAYHRAVIEAVDQLLIPSASNGELKQTLVSVRPALVAHQKHAEHLQQSLR